MHPTSWWYVFWSKDSLLLFTWCKIWTDTRLEKTAGRAKSVPAKLQWKHNSKKELAQLKKFKGPSFHCIIQVYENSVISSDAPLMDMIQVQFHPIKVRYIKLNNKEAMVTVYVSNCQRVLKLNSSYVRISVMAMVSRDGRFIRVFTAASVSTRSNQRKRTKLNELTRRFTISVTMLQISRRRWRHLGEWGDLGR